VRMSGVKKLLRFALGKYSFQPAARAVQDRWFVADENASVNVRPGTFQNLPAPSSVRFRGLLLLMRAND
jgi:hypothetical protein